MTVNEQYIRERITELREAAQISERKMSLDLGHSTSYIRSISSGKALPSLGELLYICEYLGISMHEFFNEYSRTSAVQQKAIDYIRTMPDSDVALIINFIERIKSTEK